QEQLEIHRYFKPRESTLRSVFSEVDLMHLAHLNCDSSPQWHDMSEEYELEKEYHGFSPLAVPFIIIIQ
ncbi:hypothetical protein AVEN_75011-1, partial [Araneus ventricosus]